MSEYSGKHDWYANNGKIYSHKRQIGTSEILAEHKLLGEVERYLEDLTQCDRICVPKCEACMEATKSLRDKFTKMGEDK